MSPKTRPAPARIPFVDPKQLSNLVRQSRRQGQMVADLATAIETIAHGVHARHGFHPDRDDFAQECLLKALKGWKRFDPTKNLFNLIFTLCMNVGRELRERTDRRAKADAAVRELTAASGLDAARDLAQLPTAYRRLHRLVEAGRVKEAKSLALTLIVTDPPCRAG